MMAANVGITTIAAISHHALGSHAAGESDCPTPSASPAAMSEATPKVYVIITSCERPGSHRCDSRLNSV